MVNVEEIVPTILNGSTPSIAALADGGHLAVWSSSDGSGGGIWAQRYDAADQPVGAIYQIHTTVHWYQSHPQITALADGSLIAVWQTPDATGHRDIMAQKLDATGQPVGAEFPVNTFTNSNQDLQSITPLPDGGFVIIWDSVTQDTATTLGVFGQVYNAAGTPSGAEFQVNTAAARNQLDATVTTLADGGFVVMWRADLGVWGSDPDFGIFGQRYDSTGAAVGTEFHVNTTTQGEQASPEVVALEDGGFVAIWASSQETTQGYEDAGLYLQRFGADGATVGEEIQLETDPSQFKPSNTGNPQQIKQAIELQGGGFAILWIDPADGSIHVQSFDASGKALALAEQFVTNATANSNFVPDLDQLNDGRLVVT